MAKKGSNGVDGVAAFPVPDVSSERIKRRYAALQKEIHQLVTAAYDVLETEIEPGFEFEFKSSAPGDIVNDYERAQVLCFVLRYRHLPVLDGMHVVGDDDEFHVANLDFMRHILNEYRSIIQNERDSIHYRKVHDHCRQKLELRDPSKGTICTVFDEGENDITEQYITLLGERVKAISIVMKALEFDYIYNGILQHSDEAFSRRFVDDYTTGELNYVLAKHAHIVGVIKDLLYHHSLILHSFFYPKMGGL